MEILEVQLRFILLHMVRCLALVATLPMFVSNGAARIAKISLGIALGVLIALPASRAGFVDPGPSLLFVACLLKEFLLGVFLGWMVTAMFSVVKVAGHLIGEEMGYSFASIQDPITGVQTPIIGNFLELLALAAFVTTGGVNMVIRALASSFSASPVGDPTLNFDMLRAAMAFGSWCLEGGLEVAGPIFALLLLSAIALAVLARSAPELQIMQFSYAIKVGLGLILLVGAFDTLPVAFERLFDHGEEVLLELLR